MALNDMTAFDRDASLVLAYQEGNREAFTELMRLHLAWVYALCRRVSTTEAEDLCQEIFLQAYQSLPKLRHPQSFVAWLRRLAWRHCQKQSLRHGRLASIDETAISCNPWEAFFNGIELDWAFDQLPLNQRQVAALSLVYGFTEKHIADVLGIPRGTVKSRLHTARKSLQSLLHETEGDMDMDIRERIIKEVDSRIQEFNDKIVKPSYSDPEKMALLDENAQKWHQLRQADAESNAKLYGIPLADVGPRMTREKIMSGTLSRVGITREVMGVPETAEFMDLRDATRRLLVSPFTLLKWEEQGMPTVRYYPWKWLDLDLIKKWLADNEMDLPREVTLEEMDVIERFVLVEVQAGRASIEDALVILESD